MEAADARANARRPAEIRARAAELLLEVAREGRSLDALFADQGGSPQERGLLRALVYGSVRWHIRLTAALEKLSSRPPDSMEPLVRALAQVGLFQLLQTDIAAHAAVAETVEAARHLQQAHARGFINAILRRAQRERSALQRELATTDAIRTSHPQWLVDALADDWPREYSAMLDANNEHPPMWLRVNAARCSVEQYLELLSAAGLTASRSPMAPEALLLSHPVDVNILPHFADGFVSVQDAAAQLAPHLLECKAGDRVLDACAAPGGKTCHILELQANVELTALDVSPQRLRRVDANLQRLGLVADVRAGDAGQVETWWNGKLFDRILLDVPCSATGVIRRHPDIKLLRRATDIAALCEQQRHLLATQWRLLAPGGRLVYASCSSLRAETSTIVSEFLHSNVEAIDATPACKLFEGRARDRGPGYAVVTGEAQMDGFYYACLDKQVG